MQSKKTKTKDQKSKPKFAKKSLGQNFLIDQNYIAKIIDSLALQPNETVIEIGPGRGALTEKLVESGANVIAIELDRNLVPLLKDKFADYEKFTVIEQDALEADFQQFQIPNSKFQIKLVANLPYYISTAILQRLIEQREVFSEMILMLQREVVERITAKVGNSERGFLTVLVKAYAQTEKLFDVPPTAFRPVPKVWSSVVSIKPKVEIKIMDEHKFREIVSYGFRQKRKTIFNNLKNAGNLFPPENILSMLEELQIEQNRRAETLTIEEWISLTNYLLKK